VGVFDLEGDLGCVAPRLAFVARDADQLVTVEHHQRLVIRVVDGRRCCSSSPGGQTGCGEK
jgi:hypothetical protein